MPRQSASVLMPQTYTILRLAAHEALLLPAVSRAYLAGDRES